jgi:hypothetical protein
VDESELNGGVDNHSIIQAQPLRIQNNIYEYRDSPGKYPMKPLTDTSSIRSPSSLGMTQTTKVGGSQSSLRSAISMKEKDTSTISPTSPTPKEAFREPNKFTEREIDVRSDKSDNRSLLSSATSSSVPNSKKDFTTSSPLEKRPTTPVGFKNKNSVKNSRTHLIDGQIPQTEV